ncbi:MAG: ABC-2 transporter permease [Clostridium sp.]|uniref:ABC-2 transporter permease n=1 Tax=Clostridium sp. TaxID=1506 RepID=UPI003D6D8E77
MKELLLNYVKMLKAGFFYKTFLYALLLISPSVVKAFSSVRSDFYEIFFVIIVGFIIVSLGMNEISEKKYIFCLTLPIKTKDIIKMAYFHTYIIYILGFIGTIFVSIFSHQELPKLYLLFIVLYLLCTNLLYPTLASCELKPINDPGSYVWATIVTLGMGFIALCSWIVGLTTVLNWGILAIIIVSFLAALTLKMSYKATFKKVMGF